MERIRWEVIGVAAGVAAIGVAVLLVVHGGLTDAALTVVGVTLIVGAVLLAALVGTPLPRLALVGFWKVRGIPKSSATLAVAVTRAAANVVLPDEVQFTTNDQPPATIVIPNRTILPTRLYFVRPEKKTIWYKDLPAEIWGRLGTMRIPKFVPGGFVLEENGCRGDDVRVEVYFD
jgi:hypothetical protein